MFSNLIRGCELSISTIYRVGFHAVSSDLKRDIRLTPITPADDAVDFALDDRFIDAARNLIDENLTEAAHLASGLFVFSNSVDSIITKLQSRGLSPEDMIVHAGMVFYLGGGGTELHAIAAAPGPCFEYTSFRTNAASTHINLLGNGKACVIERDGSEYPIPPITSNVRRAFSERFGISVLDAIA